MVLSQLFSRINNTFVVVATCGIAITAMVGMTLGQSRALSQEGEVLGAQVPVFNKNLIMTDTALRSTRAFPTLQSVQNYFVTKDSPMARYSEGGKSGAQIIYEAARGITSAKWNITPQINPGVLIAYLEKEQSLITKDAITSDQWNSRLKHAMGYGCPDNQSCNPKYEGFTNQLNWAAYQLEYNYYLATRTEIADPYKINTTITTLDPDNVYLTNAATAVHYRYTPHVFWGNYNLWKIMTANGWGDSAETFTYTEIENANPNKRASSAITPSPSVVMDNDIQTMLANPPALGTENASISKLQQFLRDKGFFTYPIISGYYGSVTQAALQAYKSSAHYTPSKPVSSDVSCESLKSRSWSIGESSEDVRKLQQCMQDLGHFVYYAGPTGYFGSVTADALSKWKGSGVVSASPSANTGACSSLISQAREWNLGYVGQDVRQLQQCLKDAGIYTWQYGVTGYYGDYTRGLVMGGGSSTTSTQSSSVCQSQIATARSWNLGYVGQDVRQLQQCLKDAGIYTWQYGVTGYYGDYTRGLVQSR